MKTERTIKWLVAGVSLVAFRSAEAARGFGGHADASPAFRDQHPVAMVLINLLGVVMIVVVCALIMATASRKSNTL
ncbi:MAG: hypothetical protein WCG36_04555 [bacterium]